MSLCPVCDSTFHGEARFCPVDGAVLIEEEVVPDESLLGQVVDGRYRLDGVLGRGAVGSVFLVEHIELGKKFALKSLRGPGARDSEVRDRFVREAQSCAAIGHQAIVEIFDFGTMPDGSTYFVMEYLDGKTLGQQMREKRFEMVTLLHIGWQIAEALSAAHQHGIVHRDLKPDNIILIEKNGDANTVKIVDFGVAKVGNATVKLTQQGGVFGTPHYVAPEQAAGEPVDERADVYALGVILYQLATGAVPFDGDTFIGVLSQHMFDEPVRPSSEGFELGELEPLILKALEKKPEERFQTMAEFAEALQAVDSGLSTVALPLADYASSVSELTTSASAASSSGSVFPTSELTKANRARFPMLTIGCSVLSVLMLGFGSAYAYHTYKNKQVKQVRPAKVVPTKATPLDDDKLADEILKSEAEDNPKAKAEDNPKAKAEEFAALPVTKPVAAAPKKEDIPAKVRLSNTRMKKRLRTMKKPRRGITKPRIIKKEPIGVGTEIHNPWAE